MSSCTFVAVLHAVFTYVAHFPPHFNNTKCAWLDVAGLGGASLESDDRSMVCLPATAKVGDRVLSRIQARLPLGSIITTPRHAVDLVVTEYGAADLRGKTVTERAAALAAIAHPDARDALRAGEDDVAVE